MKLSTEDARLYFKLMWDLQFYFQIFRYLKKHAIFIGEDSQVYGVLALQDSLEEMFYGRPLPIMVQAVLLPFRGKIIYDALTHGLHWGSRYWVLEPISLLLLTGFAFSMVGFALDEILNPKLKE